MQYYAKTYTADPATGLITPGEFLTEKQEAALGEERIAEMVARGVLGAMGKKPAQAEAPAKSEEPAKPKAKAAKADTKAKVAQPEEESADEAEDDGIEGEEDGEELPELDAAELIGEDEKPAATTAKKGGRRKTK